MNQGTFVLIGVGHAGGQALECLLRSGLGGFETAFADTDSAEVGRSSVPRKLCLGAHERRGLGAGGDPEQGRLAAESEIPAIREIVNGARMVCIFAGLGGGTGSGAAPVIARVAREAGALVLGFGATPFSFEGRRRAEDAQIALNTFKKEADVVICISNHRIMRMLDERTALPELIQQANFHVVQAFKGLWQALTQPGLLAVDFAHIEQLFRGRHGESCFAMAEASGEHRVRDVWDRLLQHPFLDQGAVLPKAKALLVSIAGGPDLTAPEVERFMDQLQRQCEFAKLETGAVIEESLRGSFRVTLIAAWDGETAPPPSAPVPAIAEVTTNDGLPDESLTAVQQTPGDQRFVPPAPELNADQRRRVLGRRSRGLLGRKQPQQLMMEFDVVSKSRFDRTEPHRVKGQNLDIPTYIRRGIALN